MSKDLGDRAATPSRSSFQIRLTNFSQTFAIGLLFAALAIHLLHFAASVHASITYPFGIDHAEGIVWRQLSDLGNGEMYSNVHTYPFIVYHYTPLYHLITFWASKFFGNLLETGRIVSLLATLGLAALVSTVTVQVAHAQTKPRHLLLGALVAFVTLLTFRPIFSWAALARVDMLALFWEMAGVALFIASMHRPRLFYAAALCFVLAVYTKQSIIAGASACFAVSFLLRFRFTVRVLAFAVTIGSAALLILTFITDAEVLNHIFRYNINRLDWNGLNLIGAFIMNHAATFAVAVAGGVMALHGITALPTPNRFKTWRQTLVNQREIAARVTVMAYLAISLPLTAMILKSGANHNYLLPIAVITSVLAGLFVMETIRRPIDDRSLAKDIPRRAAVSVLVLLFAGQVLTSGPRWTFTPSPEIQAISSRVLDRLRAAQGPVWSEDMTLAMLAGKDIVAEPATIKELTLLHMWDQRPLLRMIENREPALVVTLTLRSTQLRYTPEVAEAITTHYPRVEAIGPYRLRFPAP